MSDFEEMRNALVRALMFSANPEDLLNEENAEELSTDAQL
jgi:hypothetical protein